MVTNISSFFLFCLGTTGCTAFAGATDQSFLVRCADYRGNTSNSENPDDHSLLIRGPEELTHITAETFVMIPLPKSDVIVDLSVPPYKAKGRTVTGLRVFALGGGGLIRSPMARLKDGIFVEFSTLQPNGGITVFQHLDRKQNLNRLPNINGTKVGKSQLRGDALSAEGIRAYESMFLHDDVFERERYFDAKDIDQLKTCSSVFKRLRLEKAEQYYNDLMQTAAASVSARAIAIQKSHIEIEELPFDVAEHKKRRTKFKIGAKLQIYKLSGKYKFATYHLLRVTFVNGSNEAIIVPQVWPCTRLAEILQVSHPFTRIDSNIGWGGSCRRKFLTLRPGRLEDEILVGGDKSGKVTLSLPADPPLHSEPFSLK
jgi:hypothetical protein